MEGAMKTTNASDAMKMRASSKRGSSSLFAIPSQVLGTEDMANDDNYHLPTPSKDRTRRALSESTKQYAGQLEELLTSHANKDASCLDFDSSKPRSSNATAATVLLADASEAQSMSGSSYGYHSSSRPSVTPSLEYTVPESSKLRGGRRLSSTNQKIPLPVKLSQMGLFGRDQEVEIIQKCLKEQWSSPTTDDSGKKDSTSSSPTTDKKDEDVNTNPPKRQRHLIWVAGQGGTGKSSLVEFALKDLVPQLGGLLIQGKCDSQSKGRDHKQTRPLEAIAMACEDLCVQLLASKGHDHEDTNRYGQLEASLKEEMSLEEATLLKRLITGLEPILQCILGTQPHDDDNQHPQDRSSESAAFQNDGGEDLPTQEAKHQFHFVLNKFLKIVAAFFPLVLVADDVQWADMACIEVLQTLAMDPDPAMKQILLVACYRDDEVDEQHRVADLQSTLKETTASALQTTQINLGDLSVDALNPLLAELLDFEDNPEKVLPLTEICHKRVRGNPFFFVQFVLTMCKDQLITYDPVLTQSYKWDLSKIQETSSAADNVVDFLTHRLAALPPTTRQLLLLASCLGVEFDVETLASVMIGVHVPNTSSATDHNGASTTTSSSSYDAKEDLQRAVDEGVVEVVPVRSSAVAGQLFTHTKNAKSSSLVRYRWVHDRIVEAAQGLIDVGELPKLKVCIGEILLRSFGDARLEDELFVVVNLLNEDPTLSKKPLQLAELNLRAAQKAASLSSFEGASQYCQQGVSLLPSGEEAWTTHYKLALQLHSMAADMCSVLGDHEGAKREANKVVDQPNVPLLDRIPSHEVLMDSAFRQGPEGVQEAFDMSYDMLRQLGARLPKNKAWATLQLIAGIKRHTSQVDKLCSQLRALPAAQDEMQKVVSRYLITICKFSTVTGSPFLVLAPMKMMSCAIESDGLAEDTALSIAVVGMVVTNFGGDIQAGAKYANLALELAERIQSQRRYPEVLMYANGFVLHHTKPVHLLLKPLLRAYNLCLQTGNVDHAAYTIHAYLVIAFRSGKALDAIEKDLQAYTQQVQHVLKVQFVTSWANLLWQAIQNLMGFPGTKATVLTGAAMDEDTFLAAKPDPFSLGMYHSYHSQLFALFGEHKKSAKLSIARKGPLGNVGNAFMVMDVCYRAVSVFAVARASKKLKYKRHAKSLKSQIDKWAKAGDPNVVHFKCVLDAELAALGGKKQEAEQHYEKAITTAARHGFVQDAALFNERLAEFYQVDLKDLSLASFRFQEAIRIYDDWGAQGKVAHLTEKTSSLRQKFEDGSHPGQVYVDVDDQSFASGFSMGFFSSR